MFGRVRVALTTKSVSSAPGPPDFREPFIAPEPDIGGYLGCLAALVAVPPVLVVFILEVVEVVEDMLL